MVTVISGRACIICRRRAEMGDESKNDHVRNVLVTDSGFVKGSYHPRLTEDERKKIPPGTWGLCSNRKACRKRFKRFMQDYASRGDCQRL